MMKPTKEQYLIAMKAERIPEGWSGLWRVHKNHLPKGHFTIHEGEYIATPPGTYTWLRCLTDATMHQLGDVVMEDTPHELQTHLGFVMRAFGKVLVSGLGLGCVVRGLLANPKVEHVTCLENSKDVLKLVGPHMPTERLTIVETDALVWTAQNKECFDCAWHDLYTDECKGEPHLNIWHAQLFVNCLTTVAHQGAWAFDRDMKTNLKKRGFSWIG